MMSTTENDFPNSQRRSFGWTGLVDGSHILKRKWYIVTCLALALAAGGAYLHFAKPVYTVGARILLQCASLELNADAPTRVDPRFVATQAEILRSPVIVARAMEAAGFPEASDDPATSNGTDGVVNVESLVKSLNVIPVGSTSVLAISMRGPDATDSIALVDAIIDNYTSFMNEMQHGNYSETLRLLTEREAALRDELQRLESSYEQLRADDDLFGEGKEVFAVRRTMLQGISARLSDTKIQRIDTENQLREFAEVKSDLGAAAAETPPRIHASVTDRSAAVRTASSVSHESHEQPRIHLARNNSAEPASPASVELEPALLPVSATMPESVDTAKIQQQIWEAESRVVDLGKVFGPRHPEVRAAQQQIAMWKRILDDIRRDTPRALANSLENLTSAEQYLTKQYDDVFTELKSLDLALLKEQRAMENIQRVEAIHNATLQQLQDLKISNLALADGSPMITVRKLDGDQPTVNLVWPRTTQVLTLTSILGLLLGFTAIVLVDRRAIMAHRTV